MTQTEKLAVNTIRVLSAEAVERAKSGHPGMPLGMADIAFVLWHKYLKFNPADPGWIARDRFILSAGHGSMLLYSLLHLSGYDVSMDDIKAFRQLNSRTPGHPELGCLPGVETTTGPLGQGFANGIGMAIAARMTGEIFNRGESLFDSNYIYAIVSDGDIMEGISSESASYAGYLGLGNVIYIYDDNGITIEGKTDITYSDDVGKRFRAYGWHTVRIDGHDHEQIALAIEEGQNEKNKPTLIIARTVIGYGSPNKADSPDVHGSPLGEAELKETAKNLGWAADRDFFVPEEVKILFSERVRQLKLEYLDWQNKFGEWKIKNPEQALLYRNFITGNIPDEIESLIYTDELIKEGLATRQYSGKILQKIADLIPFLVGGSADLGPSNNTLMKNYPSVLKGNLNGRNLHFGVREHGMAGILNGISQYGGFIPYGATFLVFSDYMKPSIRLAALSKLQVIYVFTHDSVFTGEDGPTHQPIEHIAALRIIPNLKVLRPADGLETLSAWVYALKNKTGPTALILTRQKVGSIPRISGYSYNDFASGGYIVYEGKKSPPDVVIFSNGSELSPSIKAAEILGETYSVRVISVPCLEIFKSAPQDYLKELIPPGAGQVVVEAANTSGWGDFLRGDLLKIEISDFGKSAPYKVLEDYYGYTPEKIAARIRDWLRKQTT